MKTLIMVMAHAGAQDTVDRHVPLWNCLGDVVISCPPDSIVKTRFPVLALGANKHNGWEVNYKFRRILNFMLTMDYDYFQFHEYDSLCLSRAQMESKADSNVLFSNVFRNNGETRFKGGHYFHPPLTMSKLCLEKVCGAMNYVLDDEESGFWDRLIGLACERAGVAFSGYDQFGFARNTIEPHMIPDAVAARKAGAVFFHGVKTEAVLNALLTA